MQQFVLDAENGRSSGITVLIDGQILTGTLISGREYFDAIIEEESEGMNEEQIANIRHNIQSLAAIYYTEERFDSGQDPSYFHLKDARFIVNGQLYLPGQPCLMRACIARVSAVIWNRMTLEPIAR